MHLEKLRQERTKWRTKSSQVAVEYANEDLAEHDNYIKNLASSQTEQFRQLTKAAAYRQQGNDAHGPDVK